MVAGVWLWLIALAAILLCGLWVLLCIRARWSASSSAISHRLAGQETIGFFHPYAHAGGGGERVLWSAVQAVQQYHPGVHSVIYTGDTDVSPGELLSHAEIQFGIHIEPRSTSFVFLTGRHWVDAKTWPHFTLLGQSLGSVFLGWEALCQFKPDIFIDTMGYAFTYPLFALVGGCRVGCYVHYPVVSTDMLDQVRKRDVSVCNNVVVARSWVLSTAKLLYYRVFAALYGLVGRFSQVVMVNSSWTRGHIEVLWRVPERTITLFPPCDTSALAALPLERRQVDGGGHMVVSLAQFRPEKNHALQLRALARLFSDAPQHRAPGSARVRLLMAGGCRDAGDEQRVESLRSLASELGLREQRDGDRCGDWDVQFRTNIPLDEVHMYLGQSAVGLHTMREEHFGINVVEFMAAGAIPLAHQSGGPAMDIVVPLEDGRPTGFLASDEATYAAALLRIFAISTEDRLRIARSAREAVSGRFSQEAFREAFASRMVAPLRQAPQSRGSSD